MPYKTPHVQCYSVVADVGGTNTRIALTLGEQIQNFSVQHFANDEFESFDLLLKTYLKSQQITSCTSACIAIASAINGNSATLTNRDWLIDKIAIAEIANCKEVILLNDFEALALSLNHIPENELITLFESTGNDGSTNNLSKKIVLGAGTGFNAAQLLETKNSGPQVSCAECGHMTLPIETEHERKLRDALALLYSRTSVERVLSGKGLVQLYQWTCSEKGIEAEGWNAAQIAASACAGNNIITREVGELFCRFFARVAGDLALAYLPYGGIYLSGGVTRGLAPLLKNSYFLQEFTAKGRQTKLMKSFDIKLITSDHTALIGCATALPKHAHQ